MKERIELETIVSDFRFESVRSLIGLGSDYLVMRLNDFRVDKDHEIWIPLPKSEDNSFVSDIIRVVRENKKLKFSGTYSYSYPGKKSYLFGIFDNIVDNTFGLITSLKFKNPRESIEEFRDALTVVYFEGVLVANSSSYKIYNSYGQGQSPYFSISLCK